MANTKISALTSASTPLAGTETLPVVQSGVTKQVSVANLTNGRDVSAKNITATQSVLFGQSGTYAAGCLYSDSNWGLITRAKQASPATAEFAWMNSAGTELVQITTTNDFKIATGNVIIGTAGKGIDFSATAGTGTSELLADYEEGNWTPVPVPVTGSITSYTSAGYYVKVGRQVTIEFRVTITNVGTGTTLSTISGIPFVNNYGPAAGCGRENGVTGAMWQYVIQAGTSTLNGWNYVNVQTLATNYILYGTITYFT